jgi:hypothetical protein
LFIGSVAEWSIAPVLKTGNPKGFVSSNLTASANKNNNLAQFLALKICDEKLYN